MGNSTKEPPKYCTGYAEDNEGYEALADDVEGASSVIWGDNANAEFIWCPRLKRLVSKDAKKAKEDYKRSMRNFFDG